VEGVSAGSLLAEVDRKIAEFEELPISFIDREQELNTLINTFLPITIVYGRFGQGKTKLARQLIHILSERKEEVVYIALRTANQIRAEFLTLREIFKTYYNSIGVAPPRDFAHRLLWPLIVDPAGLKTTYNDLGAEALYINTHRSSPSRDKLVSIYSSGGPREVLEFVKDRVTIIVDEFEDLINNFAKFEGELVTRTFIDSLFTFARFAYDLRPGAIRLILLVVPRTVIDLRSIISEGSIAWIGVTQEVLLEKLSEDNLIEYAERLTRYLLGSDVSLRDIFDEESIKILRMALTGIPTTRFATDLIKQIIRDAIKYLGQTRGLMTYEDLRRKLPETLKLLREQKLHYDIQNYLKLYEPSHDEIVRNYRKILELAKKILMKDYKRQVVGPGMISMLRGYESYYLEMIKASGRGRERFCFIFWLRPSAIKPKNLNVDRIVQNLDLRRLQEAKAKIFVFIVSFKESKYLKHLIDVLNSQDVIADVWIHDEVIKYALSDRQPPELIRNALEDYLDEDVRRIVDSMIIKSEIL
jgi:hypothetical protein